MRRLGVHAIWPAPPEVVSGPWLRNFVKTMLRLGAERAASSPIVADQIGRPDAGPPLIRGGLTLAIRRSVWQPIRRRPAPYTFLGRARQRPWAIVAAPSVAEAGLTSAAVQRTFRRAPIRSPHSAPLNSRSRTDSTTRRRLRHPARAGRREGLRWILSDPMADSAGIKTLKRQGENDQMQNDGVSRVIFRLVWPSRVRHPSL